MLLVLLIWQHTALYLVLTCDEPVTCKAYPVPFALRETVDAELEKMLLMSIIEPSTSAYASPIAVVRKPENSIRLCVDYRKLNRYTVFGPEPIPTAENIFAKLKTVGIFQNLT